MKIGLYILLLLSTFSFSQEQDKAQLLASKKANDYVFQGNTLIGDDDYVSAEMAYRKAISERPETTEGIYNLGTAYYKSGAYNEALYRLEQAVQTASTKAEKHKVFHNIGNILMKNKQCKEAVEAYKSALRNDPTDNETRYNLGIAKVCAAEQKDQEDQNKDDQENKDDNKDQENEDNKEENKDSKDGDDKEEEKNKDNKEGDDKEDKKDSEDKKEDGKPKDDKEDQGKEGQDKKEEQKPQPQPGQLSPQQIESLLEAMGNQEQKVQEKMNAEKQKGVIIKTDKDW
ncbi:tetratricopeptide repeat protein [Mariniflexile ostreae]|uniref:Tetratricopeptide repeat protein n=1 Tax=Mariniflexile ostreae TaxID=1520892 RepID=A0ABV5F6U3_9FLAO